MFGDLDSNTKGWKKEPLKKHADILVGYPFPSSGYSEKGIKIIGGYNLMQGYINWDDSKYWPTMENYEQYLLKDGDIVMAMDRPWTGDGFKMAFIDGTQLPALLIQLTACIRASDIENEFLYTLLNSQWFADHCNVKGSLVPHISNKDMNSFMIYIPPNELQKEFVRLYQQSDKSKFVKFKSQFIEMFGNPIMKEKDESLPTLGEVCILKAGKFVKADSIKEKQEDGLFPCFGGNGLRGYVPSFNQEGEFPLIGRQGALCGNVQYAVGKFHATEHAVVVTPNIEMDRFWLYHLLCLLDLNRYASGAAQPGLAVNKLEAIRVFVPDLQLQKQYSEFAKQSDKSK